MAPAAAGRADGVGTPERRHMNLRVIGPACVVAIISIFLLTYKKLLHLHMAMNVVHISEEAKSDRLSFF